MAADLAATFAAAAHTQASSTITDFSEAVDDRVSSLLVAGSNVSLTYNDPANTLTIGASAAHVTTTDPGVGDDSGDGYAAGSLWFNSSSARLFICRDATVGAAVWLPIDNEHPGYVVGRKYGPGWSTTAAAMGAIDRIYLYPFRIRRRIQIDEWGAWVTTGGASSAVKFAIWAPGTNGFPDGAPIIAQNTEMATTASGVAITFANTRWWEPGWYWAGTKAKATLPSMQMVQADHPPKEWIGGTNYQIATGNTLHRTLQFDDAYSNNMPTFSASSFTPNAVNAPAWAFNVAAVG